MLLICCWFISYFVGLFIDHNISIYSGPFLIIQVKRYFSSVFRFSSLISFLIWYQSWDTVERKTPWPIATNYIEKTFFHGYGLSRWLYEGEEESGYLDGSKKKPDPTNATYSTWDTNYALVMYWLMNSMEENIESLYLVYTMTSNLAQSEIGLFWLRELSSIMWIKRSC